MTNSAKYYDGKIPVSRPVTWEVKQDLLIVTLDNGTRLPSWELKDLVQDEDTNTAYVILNTATNERLEMEEEPIGLPPALFKRKKVSLKPKLFAGVVVGIILLIVGLWQLTPVVSRYVAGKIPAEQEKYLAEKLLAEVHKDLPACRPNDKGRRAFAKLMKRVYPLYPGEKAEDLDISVVDVQVENAFTFPGGKIVIFDGLIKSSESPEELAGVLAHEIGHAKERHILQKIVQTLSFTFIFQFISGDFSSAFAIDPSTLLGVGTLSFDRGMESEADLRAKERLIRSQLRSDGLVTFFERQEKKYGSLKVAKTMKTMNFLSTHPGNEDRVKFFKQPSVHKTLPLLSAVEWKDLKSYCDPLPDLEPIKKILKKKQPSALEKARDNGSFQFPGR